MSQDREFETYLQGKTDLSKAYAHISQIEQPQVEVPDHLEAAILAEAHRAVGARPGDKPKRRWAIPLSLVASLMVAVLVGLQMPYMLKEAALTQAPKEDKVGVATLDKSLAEQVSPATEARNKIQPMAKAKSELASTERASIAGQSEAPAKQGLQEFAAPKQAAGIIGSVNETVAPSAQNAAGMVNMPQSPPVVESGRLERALKSAPSAAPAFAAKHLREPVEIDQGAALAKEKKVVGNADSYVSDALEQNAPAPARMAAPAAAQLEDGLPLNDKADLANLSKADWLARIKNLQQQGKLDEAKKELAAFKKRYPDHPIPKALEMR